MHHQVKNGAHHAGCAAALAFAAAIALAPRQGGAVTTYAFSPGYSGDHVHFSDPLNYYTKVAPPSNIFDSRLRLFLSGKYAENDLPADHLLNGVEFTAGAGTGHIDGNPFPWAWQSF